MVDIIIGIISGSVSGMGMGGGTILILCLSLFMGIDQHIAQGANLIFFIPTSLVSIFMNFKHKLIKWKTGIVVGICGIIGAICGAMISVNMDTGRLKTFFGIFLLIIAGTEILTLIKNFKSK